MQNNTTPDSNVADTVSFSVTIPRGEAGTLGRVLTLAGQLIPDAALVSAVTVAAITMGIEVATGVRPPHGLSFTGPDTEGGPILPLLRISGGENPLIENFSAKNADDMVAQLIDYVDKRMDEAQARKAAASGLGLAS